VVWAMSVPQPDVLIAGDGRNVGVRGRDGRLHLIKTGKDTFLFNEWLAADADGRRPGDATLADGVSCDDEGCVVQMADGGLVALSLKPDALADDCERAALLVTARPVPSGCAATVIDLARLRGQGATALRRTSSGFVVEAVTPHGVNRPWDWFGNSLGTAATQSAAQAESATAASRRTPRAVDATPAEADLEAED
jgi:competence protein ComEC